MRQKDEGHCFALQGIEIEMGSSQRFFGEECVILTKDLMAPIQPGCQPIALLVTHWDQGLWYMPCKAV